MIDVVAAIIEDGGQFLACRRRIERAEGGSWEFPGGKVEPGESTGEAVVREIREELDIDVRSSDIFTTVNKGDLRLIFVHAELVGERPLSSTDHDRLDWLSPEQLLTVAWAPADEIAVERLLARKGLDHVEPVAPTNGESDS